MAGTLYVVATPLGNFEDITYRAVRILSECDSIFCEDTRHSRRLLDHFGIRKPLFSLHDHNELARIEELLARLNAGESAAIVSDAGTPLISDPGYRAVKAASEALIRVVPIPGASAITAALSSAGLPTDRFYFGGFLPPKSGARRAELESRRDEPATLIYFETPHRILEALRDVEAVMPGRRIAAARELTKMHEEILRGTAPQVQRQLEARPAVLGEFTLLIAKEIQENSAAPEPQQLKEQVQSRILRGEDRKTAIKAVAKQFGMAKAEVYRQLLTDGDEPSTAGAGSGDTPSE